MPVNENQGTTHTIPNNITEKKRRDIAQCIWSCCIYFPQNRCVTLSVIAAYFIEVGDCLPGEDLPGEDLP